MDANRKTKWPAGIAIAAMVSSLAIAMPAMGAGPATPADTVVTASADSAGYHLFVADDRQRWRWRPLATLQPGGFSGESWIGEHCLTGDGRFVVAVVAPWSANNSPAGQQRGGVGYAIEVSTGAVRSLAGHLSLAYFNPGCGFDATAALTRLSGKETEILRVDLATGRVGTSGRVPGFLTSGVPVGGSIVAVQGNNLVRLENGTATRLSALPGRPFRLTPGAGGGVDFLTVEAQGRAAAYSWAQGGLPRRLGEGKLDSVALRRGRDGRAALTTAAGAAAAQSSSLGGALLSPDRTVVGLTGGVLGGGASLPKAAPPTTALPHDFGTESVIPPEGPSCAVPRNDPAIQVPQPSYQQIEWAVNLAGHGQLTGAAGAPLRPAGAFGLGGGAYSPSADFPLPPGFGPDQPVPAPILRGVLAQETNWHQASPHAPIGMPGNPYISDYYGYYHSGTVDYPEADCGYGLGQITDGMRLSTGQTAPTAIQKRVAADYAENIAASARILADKWLLLRSLGITAGSTDPRDLDAWYFAVWAYNSGINPQESTGGPICSPGPGCADSEGNWGMGWTNNPANTMYDPQRHPFLHTMVFIGDVPYQVRTYDDAAHPQRWPYQEKVFGWAETSQLDPADWESLKYPPTFDYESQSGYFLNLPFVFGLCDSSNHCNPFAAQPCGHSDDSDPLQWHCWWHNPIDNCWPSCHRVTEEALITAEPAVADPLPPVCQHQLPAGTVVVDDTPDGKNLVGCNGFPSGGSFTWRPGPLGQIDLHQLGAGFRGRLLFTHLEAPADAAWGGTAEWRPDIDYDVYEVRVFVPDIAAVGALTYTVADGRGRQVGNAVTVDQRRYGNEWVSIGRYYLGPGAVVRTTSVTAAGDGATDAAFDAVAFTPVPSYAALGDSYSSGEGLFPPYDPGTDVAGGNMCHRHVDAYPRRFAAAAGWSPEQTVLLACSGAVIANLTTTAQYPDEVDPQITRIPRHASLVTLTIGGNDAGFAGVLTNCLTPQTGLCRDHFTADAAYDPANPGNAHSLDARIRDLQRDLANAYREVRRRAPDAQIIVLTYPTIFQPNTDPTLPSCSPLPGVVRALPARDVQWLNSEANNLNNVITLAARAVAEDIGVLEERYAFHQHELCTGDPWVNALSGNPLNPRRESYHPTDAGNRRLADDLRRATVSPATELVRPYRNLRDPRPGTPSERVARELLAALGPATPRDPTTYDRAYFQDGNREWALWPDVYTRCAGLPQDYRNTKFLVLRRDEDSGTAPLDPCATGGWHWWTPYDDPAERVEVLPTDPGLRPVPDHVVTLVNAWRSGAVNWGAPGSNALRVDFANDIHSLELVTASYRTNDLPTNPPYLGKGGAAIDEWVPHNPGYRCTYAEMWVAIKYQWRLTVTTDEINAINTQLATC